MNVLLCGLERDVGNSIARINNFNIDYAEDSDDVLSVLRYCGTYECVVTHEAVVGHDFPRLFRARKHHSGLIMISEKNDAGHRADLLHIGADHAMSTPFDYRLLYAHVEAVTRRIAERDSSIVSFGEITIDTSSHDVMVGERHVSLTDKEYLAFEPIIKANGRTVLKSSIYNNLYPNGRGAEPKIIDVFVCKLRNKFKDVLGYDPVATRWGHGYAMQKEKADA